MLGKLASELQSNLVVSLGEATGTLKYVTGYTGFSGNPEEQAGNYIALKVNGVPEGATVKYQKVGGSAEPVTLDSDRNIVIRVTDHNAVLRFTIETEQGTVTRDVALNRLEFEEAQG